MSASVKPSRRAPGRWRRPLRIAAALVVLLIVLPALLVALVNTPPGRRLLIGIVEGAVSGPDLTLAIGRIDGTIPVDMTVRDVAVGDSAGPWLTVGRARLAWSPLALLHGRLVVNTVEAADVALDRLPAAGPADDSSQGGVPLPPLPVTLDRVAIDMTIGAPVAGVATAVTLDASGGAGPERVWIDATARIGRPGAVDGRVVLDAAWAPDSDLLDIELTATEPENGLVAALIGLAPAPPLDLRLSGDGGPSGWTGKISGGFGSGASLDLGLDLAMKPAPRAAVTGTAEVARFVPPEAAPLVSGLRIDAATRLEDDTATIETLDLRTDALSASVRGSAGPKALDLTVAAAIPKLSALMPLTGLALDGAAEVSGTVAGTPSLPAVGLTLTATGIAVDDARVGSLEATFKTVSADAEHIGVTLDAKAGGIRSGVDPADRLLAGGLTLSIGGTADRDLDDLRIERATVSAEPLTLSASGSLASLSRLDAEIGLRADDLGPLGAAIGQHLEGRASVDATVTAALDSGTADVLFGVSADGLGIGVPAIDPLLAPGVGGAGHVERHADGRISIDGLGIEGPPGRIDAEAALDPATGDIGRAELSVTLPDLALLSDAAGTALAGSVRIDASADGTLAAPRPVVRVTGDGVTAGGVAVSDIRIAADVDGLPDRPEVAFTASATALDAPVTLSTRIALDADGRIAVPALRLDGAGLTVAGAVTVDPATLGMDGRVNVTATDLGPALAIAGLQGGGRAAAAVRLAADGGQGAGISLVGRDLAIVSGESRVALARIDGTIQAGDLLAAPRGRADISLQGLATAGVAVDRASLTLDGSVADARATLEARGDVGAPFDVATELVATGVDTATPSLRIARLSGRYDSLPISLSRPATLSVALPSADAAPGTLPDARVDTLALDAGGLALTLSGGVSEGRLDAHAALETTAATLLRLAGREDMTGSGRISADLAMSGTLEAPEARLRMTAPQIALTSADGDPLPPIGASVTATLDRASLTVAARADVSGAATLDLDGGASAGLTLVPFAFDLGPATPLHGTLALNGDLTRLAPLLPLDGDRLSGRASGRITLAGTLGDPDLGGRLAVDEGRYENRSTGMVLTDIGVTLAATPTGLSVERLTARGEDGGTVTGSGALLFDAGNVSPLTASITVKDLHVLRNDLGSAYADADLKMTLGGLDNSVTGTARMHDAVFSLPTGLPASVTTVEVVDVTDGAAPAGPPPEPPGLIALDIDLTVADDTRISGRGLNSFWNGQLEVKGDVTAPRIFGGVDLQRGTLIALGRRFELDVGRIRFAGRSPPNPRIDIQAIVDIPGATATIGVSGQAKRPELEISSRPALPRGEILSRLLFGTGAAQLSATQALALANSLAGLAGQSPSIGIVDRVKKFLGLEDVALLGDGDESGGGLSASRSFGDSVDVRVEDGLGGGPSSVVLDARIIEGLNLQSTISPDDTSIGLFWKHDY